VFKEAYGGNYKPKPVQGKLSHKILVSNIFMKIYIGHKNRKHFFLPFSSYSFSGGIRGAQPTTGVTLKLLRFFAHAQRPGAKGFHMLKASEIELRHSGPNIA
jgi:hypothetical protein